MRARTASLAVVLGVLTLSALASAQSEKIHRIGVLQTGAPSELQRINRAFGDALRGLGWVSGKQVIIERRFAEGQPDRLPGLAAELVRLKVAVIVTGSNPVIAAVKQATNSIAVVMAVSRDPVGAAFVASLTRPGGHVTGLTNDPTPEIQGTDLEFLRDAAPRVSRAAILWNPVAPTRADLERAFADLGRQRADGLVVVQDPVFFAARKDVIRLAAAHRVPAVYAQSEFVDAGSCCRTG